jgi:formate hydrogenlyase subunit 6/NADH:ubiquinone oxidoreductase subunit I
MGLKFTPMISTAFKSLFSKPFTSKFPAQPMVYDPVVRGRIVIDLPTCVFCGMCSKKCPTNVIKVDRAAKSWSIERSGCIQCGNCVYNCPKNCLSMTTEMPQPVPQQLKETFVSNA